MKTILNIAGIVNDSIVDGPGIRYAIFCQGCSHNCKGCHNPETHPFGTGKDIEISQLIEEVKKNPLVRGVTFSGGDPFFQAEAFGELGRQLKALGYEVASYTGFTWEKLIETNNPHQIALLKTLDILVDGPFVLEQRNLDLRFRGSENQRIIQVQPSLEKAILGEKDQKPVLCQQERWTGEN